MNYWKRCFLQGPCQGYIYIYIKRRPVRQSVERERESAISQFRDAEAGNWGRGQFGNPEEEERPPWEATTKQRIEKRNWEH
jgi:hypothetical protein